MTDEQITIEAKKIDIGLCLCYRDGSELCNEHKAIIQLCIRARDAELERAAGIADNIDHIACTQYMDSKATGKEIASRIRNKEQPNE